MKGIAAIFILIVISRIGMSGVHNQSYSVSYRIYNRVVPIRIEFDQNRQVEYVMNLHTDGDGMSVTFYDFNQYIVIYKELTARECYITRLTDETLEKERAQLERKKNSIIDPSVHVTLFANNVPLSVIGVQKVAGSRAAKFCKGMSSYFISGARRRNRRKKRQSGPYIQRNYGHYGQQTINYSHYGHETYTLGNFGDKNTQVLQHSAADNAKKDSLGHPVFLLLPLSDQFGVKTTHSGGYQLHLPTGQAKASYSGGINGGESQISQHKKDNVKGHSWNTFQHISNSTNFPAMIIIPGMPALNIANGLRGRVIPVQPLVSKQNDEAKTSAYIATTLDNNKVLGSSEVKDHKIFISGDNKGRGSFNAQSEYISNHSKLSSKINGSPRGANASISASIPSKGAAISNAITQALAGKSYADSNLDFLRGKVVTRAEGNQQSSDAKSQATGDHTSTKAQTDIAASQNNVLLLKVNASTDHQNSSGKAKVALKNAYSTSSSASNAFGSYAGKRNQRENIIRKEPGVINDMAPTNRHNAAIPLYSTRVISPLQRPIWHDAQQTRGHKTAGFRQRSLATNYPKTFKSGLSKPTYPTVLVENVGYPESRFLFPEAKKKTRKPEFKFPRPSNTQISSNYLFRNKTGVSSTVRKKYDVQQTGKNISDQTNNLVKNALIANRNYFGVTINKLQPSKYELRPNQTINKDRSRIHLSSNNGVVYSKRGHKGLRGRNRLDRYHPSNVSGAHQTQFRKERSRYNAKHSVVSKTPGKLCCSRRHVQTRKKSELHSTGRGCCGGMIYTKIPDRRNLVSGKNCQQTCYFVYRTIERIRICKTSGFNTC